MRRLARASCVLLLLATVAVEAQRGGGAAPAESAGPFGALRWRSLGPPRGGRSLGVAGSVARPYEYYMGATGGGLWKTTDGGVTWRAVTDGQIHSSSVSAVAVAPSNPDVVYIGTGEPDIRGNIIQGDGAYKTTDAGKTWTHIGLVETQNISRIRVDPANPDVVYVAAFGHHAAPNPDRGIYRSKDGGKTWEKVLYRDAKSGGDELILDPANPQVIYAALWEASRNSWEMSSGGPGSGIFKSTDGGDHWTEISRNPGLPKAMLGKIGLSVSGADSNRVYAQIEAEDGGFFRSDDAGATWTKVTDRRDLRQRAFYYTRVYADPKTKDTVYELNVNFHKSTDGGKTWTTLRPPHGDNHDMWIAADDPKRMIEANDGGANVSVSGGETWTPETMPTAQFYHVVTTKHVPYHVCGAQQDNSTACVSSQQAQGGPGGSGGGADQVFYSVGGGESGYIASDPRTPDIYYAGSYGGLLSRLDRRTGQERAINPYPDNPMGYASADIAERFQWTFPIVMAPQNPAILYVGSQHVWKSTNEGQSWEKISPDLTRHDPKTMGASGGPITKDNTGVETYATVFTIAPSPKDANVIWAGSDDGMVSVTRNGGVNWKTVWTPKVATEFPRISLIEASPFRAGTAYVAMNRYQQDDFKPYVFRTDDYGESWTAITTGVEPNDFARAIREDTKREKLLYLGTEHGIYVSFDDGAKWESLRQNLPDTPVHDIAVEERDLVIATHGRGFYVMDNIAPLRQGGIQTTTNFHVYKPEDALRGLDRGVAVDYYLKQAAQKVTMEFLDARGNVIRTFTGTPADAERKTPSPSASDDEGGFRRQPDPKPPVGAGLHRVSWDLRYPGATEFPGLIMWAASARGPIAPPGAYQVRVTADGQIETERFAIKREPHLLKDVSDQDLQEQFDLAMKVRDKASQANEAVLLIRGIKQQIKDRRGKLKDAATTRALDEFEKQLSAIEEDIYQVRLQSSQDPLNFPIKLNNKIAALQGVIESADVKPTEQAYSVFRTLSNALDERLGQLETQTKTKMPPVNQLLQRQKLDPIKAEPLKV